MANYVFLGAPGVGKGTIAGMLADHAGLVHVSTGDMLRAEISSGSDLGNQAKECVEEGKLVPDELVSAIVSRRLVDPEIASKGVILDGYPRTVAQAEMLQASLAEAGLDLDRVVLFELSRDELISRLTSRRICSDCKAVYSLTFMPPKDPTVCDKCGGPLYQRKDDTVETVCDRLGIYERETAPLISFYDEVGKLLRIVRDNQDKFGTFAELCERLGYPKA